MLLTFSSESLFAKQKGISVHSTKIFSWYGGKLFHKHETASQVIFNENNLHMAAYNKLPLGTVAKVTNPENNKSVVIVILDRTADWVEGIGRVDLSKGAASFLEYKEDGLMTGKLEIIAQPKKNLTKKEISILVAYVTSTPISEIRL
ncbi:MAG: hypothetical protein RLZZ230_928 [Candidatus Parcubacteria bacterium]